MLNTLRNYRFAQFLGLFLLLGVAAPASGATGEARRPWIVRAVEEMRNGEFDFSEASPGVWTAPNRARNLRTHVSTDGVRFEPRIPDSAWSVSLRFNGIGRNEALAPREVPTLEATGSRIEIAAPELTEWFVNDGRGLEQGFTVPTPPPGDPAAPVIVDLRVEGGLTARLGGNDREIRFLDSDGAPVLRYGGLVVLDARQESLPARFELTETGFRIVTDDTDAVYPIVIDPIVTADWSFSPTLVDSDFGVDLASADVNGDGFSDVIVGADDYENGEVGEGRIYVFMGSASGPSLTPSWIAESNVPGVFLGNRVASAGDVNDDGYDDVIVSVPGYDNGQNNEGAAFVYYGSATGLDKLGTRPSGDLNNADWFAQGNQASGDFASSVGSAGDVNADGYDDVIIGADEYTNGQTFEGAAFVYHGSETGLNANGTRPFGTPGNPDWRAEPDRVNTNYGASVDGGVDVNGDLVDDVIVGAWNWDENFLDEGRVFVYLGSAGTGLSPTPDWFYDSGLNEAELGTSVSRAGDVNNDGFGDIIVGADFYETTGRAFVFHGSATGLPDEPSWSASTNQGAAFFGSDVSDAGDLNNDGFDDVIVGAPDYDNGQIDEGAVFVFLGSPTGLSTIPALVAEGGVEGAELGASVGAGGQINADLYDDALAGADEFTSFVLAEGVAYAYFGCDDVDRDGVCAAVDNCAIPNPNQEDTDGDGEGDVCDPCNDTDGDTFCDADLVLVQWAGSGEEVLVEAGTNTTYLANSTDPLIGNNWTLEIFNDTSWNQGPFGVGFETEAGAENLLQSVVPPGVSSIYTRTDFVIDDVNDVQNMFIGADYDDGYIAWINGVEVFRSAEVPIATPFWNLPVAAQESSNGLEPDYGSLTDISFLGIPELHDGVNVFAVGIWNTTPTSTDLVLIPRLSINRSTDTRVAYLANAADPGIGNTWISTAFNDSQWRRGNYGIGYETGAGLGARDLINTEVPDGSFSVFTRQRFSIVTAGIDTISFDVDYDDGVVAWINGTEIWRSPGMPASPGWNHESPDHESSNATEPDYGLSIDVTAAALPALVDGENILAVGVWNRGAPLSSDLVVVPRLIVSGSTSIDNCPAIPNMDQADLDMDGLGDVCDPDIDGDDVDNGLDNCPVNANPGQEDIDSDMIGDVCDACELDPNNDIDGDDICSNDDNCPTVFNPDQTNSDPDGLGDACDTDDDNDGVDDGSDNCQLTFNPGQLNGDGDVRGDDCDCSAGDNTAWDPPGNIDSLLMANTDQCIGFSCGDSGNPCSSNLDCNVDFCNARACTEGFNACSSDVECVFSGTDVCRGICTLGENSCANDLDCTGPDTDQCEGLCTIGGNACADEGACVLPDGIGLGWNAPVDPGGTTVRYDTMRAPIADDFVNNTTCIASDAAARRVVHNLSPAPGAAFYYLVRVENNCLTGNGNLGTDSMGVPRVGRTCP